MDKTKTYIIRISTVILDVEATLSTLEVSIEAPYVYRLWEYSETIGGATSPNADECAAATDDDYTFDEELVPIDTSTGDRTLSSGRTDFRTFGIKPFNVVANVRWMALCYVSVTHATLEFCEFRLDRVTDVTLGQLGRRALAHYGGCLPDNAGNVARSLELIGAPRNFACMLRRGFTDFGAMTARGYRAGGPRGLLSGLTAGSVSLVRHVSLGVLITIANLAGSWSRTLEGFRFPNVLPGGLKAVEKLSKSCADYLLSAAVDEPPRD